MKALAQLVNSSDSVLLFPHSKMDGDAAGSCGALCAALRNQGKQAYIFCDEVVPANLQFLVKDFITNDPQIFEVPGLCMAVDCGDVGRFASRKDVFLRGCRFACLDHHENGGQFEAMAEKGDVKGIYFGHDHINSFNGNVRGIDVGYTQGAGFHIYGPGLDRGVRIISLKNDGTFITYDRRYRDLVGKKVKEKFRFAMYQIMPTNVYEAFYRVMKFFCVAAAITAVILLINYFK